MWSANGRAIANKDSKLIEKETMNLLDRVGAVLTRFFFRPYQNVYLLAI